ncbi:Ribbon-helix-helix protein, copG family, partial [Dysosmobacter welbionis]
RPQAAAHGGERLRQHIEEHHEGAHRQNPGKRGPDSPGEGLRKADSLERRMPCQFLPGSGFSAAPKHQSRQKGGEHMDQPQPHPGPHTAEHPHAQHTDEEHRIGVVAEGQQPLRLLPGDQIFPVEVCCRLGADGVAP